MTRCSPGHPYIPILFAARLKVEKGKITEIETIIARERDFAFNANSVLKTKDQDWETILPPEKRASRKALADAANNYFALFAEGATVSVPFAEVCDRWENGMQTTARDHDCSPATFRKQTNSNLNHGPRRVWVDTEKGISIAFMAFGGGASVSKESPTGSGLVDCHMFRMRDGKVDLWTVAGRLIEYGPCLFEFFTDLFASLGLISDDIQNAVFCESRNIGVHIEEIKGKQVTGLKVFNLRPVFRIAALTRV
jgi:hypothetical protein